MRSTRVIVVLLTALMATVCSRGSLLADEGEIREAIKAYVAAFNAKDLATIERLWAEKAVYVDHQSGERTDGRAAIVQDIKTVFENTDSLNLAGTVESVRMVRDDVASINGQVMLTVGTELSVTDFTAILLKQNNAWVIDSMDERAVAMPSTAADALAELQWLVGDWVDASGESPVRASVKMAIGGSFLVRTFQTATADGTPLQSTQIIGWDPRAQQFRSWTFDADGSFGDGMWSRNDNQWLIKSTQTLADGKAASGTYVMTVNNPDSFTVQLIGRDIEGEPQPASAIVTVKRALQQPASDTTPSR